MNILIFSHSSNLGGAENALIDFISLLIREHRVSVMLPTQKGALVDKLKMMGVKCGVFPIGISLPNPAKTLLDFCDPNIGLLIEQLKTLNYDLVVVNTIATLPGMLIARELNIPCVTYAHEYLLNDMDCVPHGCTPEFYLQLIESLSSHILCASEFVKSSFLDQEKCSVLYPFTSNIDKNESHGLNPNADPFSLLVIGIKSTRKNTHFALTVHKALRLRGKSLNLHIIGPENSGSYKLKQQNIIRGERNVFIHPYLSEPYNIPGKKINLVCSYSEPFGLTISESLARGIPTAASKSGGPNEILPEEFIYEIDDVDGCVRVLERIMNKYEEYSALSKIQYLKISEKNIPEVRLEIMSNAIKLACLNFNSSPKLNIPLSLEGLNKIIKPIISCDQIIENISIASKNTSHALSVEEIRDLVSVEMKSPGASVLRDIKEFDVVPFGYSENMNLLYKGGLGLAIELLANIKDSDKRIMITYIFLRLQEVKFSNPNLKILCLGDDLGVNSIILASCGFHVDYIGFDQSLMSGCTELNIETVKLNGGDELKLSILKAPNPPYDAILSLEMIERVPNPQEFLKYLSGNLTSNGLLFVSECFDGIYDWGPTNLYVNEKFASTLPVLAAPYFNLEDVNTLPLGKPYVFSKNLANIAKKDSFTFFDDQTFFNSMAIAKTKIGF